MCIVSIPIFISSLKTEKLTLSEMEGIGQEQIDTDGGSGQVREDHLRDN